MTRFLLSACLLALALCEARAGEIEAVFAKRTVRAGALVSLEDVELRRLPDHQAAGVAHGLEDVIGQEVRRSLYADRPVRLEDVGKPTIIRRNSLVSLTFQRGRIVLTTIGRALDDGGLGELVRVVNVDSRLTVVGVAAGPDAVHVGPAAPSAGDRP